LHFLYTFFYYSGDIIIERWVPYGPPPKRRTIVQRAAAAVQYPRPRNIIVVYDSVQARVIRQFQRFAITQEDPRAYTARHGSSLLDSAALVQQARTAGIVEDIVNNFFLNSYKIIKYFTNSLLLRDQLHLNTIHQLHYMQVQEELILVLIFQMRQPVKVFQPQLQLILKESKDLVVLMEVHLV
jgi:hypothetical protein